ncbi:OmpH family outer membrane protein [Megalodesulfovibrio paquesii]
MHRLLVILALGAMLSLAACQDNAAKENASAKAEAPKAAALANTTANTTTAPAAAPAPASTKAAAMSLAVVDENRLYEESTLGMAAQKIMTEANEKLQAELRAFQEAKKDNATDADADEFRKAAQAYQGIMRSAQTALFEQLHAKVVEAIATYRQQKGLELILSKENVLAYGTQADVTEEVLALVNALPVDDLKGPELKDKNNLFGAQ